MTDYNKKYAIALHDAKEVSGAMAASIVLAAFDAKCELLKEQAITQDDRIKNQMHGAILEIRKVIKEIRSIPREKQKNCGYTD